MSSPTTPELEANPQEPSTANVSGMWHDSTPRELVKAYPDRAQETGWDVWRRHLAKRRRPRELKRLLDTKSSPLEWAFTEEPAPGAAENRSETAALIARLNEIDAKKSLARHGLDEVLRNWLSQEDQSACNAARALQCIAWCHALPSLSATLRPNEWWDLYDSLTRTAERSAGIDCGDDPLAEQLLSCELPMALGYLFPELNQCRELAVHGRRELAEGLSNFLDEHGLLNGQHLPILRPLLACWTRSLAMARKTNGGVDKAAVKQYRKLLRQVVRLSRRDGSQVLSHDRAGQWNKKLFRAAVELSGDRSARHLASAALPGGGNTAKRAPKKGLPKPAVHSEWAELSVLRPDWSSGTQRLTANWHGRRTAIELECGRDLVFTGEWTLQVSVGGETLTPTGPWEEVCWESDRHVDYLELEIQLSGGVRVQRQMVLARKDGFLYLADAILSPRSADISYSSTLPLGIDTSYEPEVETRDGVLQGAKPRGAVMPLALPEWRSDPRVGTLEAASGGLELQQSMTGAALYAPLWIDLERRRVERPRTWRQLTVGEDRKKQPRDIAVGFRVQVAKEQWLIYRSMTPAANRTVLGHNLVSEFLIARFTKEGEVSALVEIDAD